MSAIRFVLSIAFFAATLGPAFAAPPPVTLREVASGLDQPVEMVSPRDGTNRLFIVERTGRIRILRGGVLVTAPFLDISAQVSLSGERGLLGLAFHPQFRFNRRFFVFYTTLPDDNAGGALRVSSFLASAANPDRADPASEREVITVPHPGASNHNSGRIAFGHDGLLFMGTGDGGGGGDVGNNAQNLTTLLGKLLRLDVNTPSGGGYIIPRNPFESVAGARQEIWAYGLRNPWKFSFDRAAGDLYIGDVGQGAVEEIDFIAGGRSGGQNYGWRVFEGTRCFNPASGCASAIGNHTAPVLQYFHDSDGGNSVTGGYVYRGTRSSALQGYYIYGDFGSNRVWAARQEGGVWTTSVLIAPGSALSGITAFGEDEAGELYVASINTGRVHAIDAPADSPVKTNVALASAGSVASASSTYSMAFPASAVNDGERTGGPWGGGYLWNDATAGTYPDWVRVDFSGMRAIDRIVVFLYQGTKDNAMEPFDNSFRGCAPSAFTVEGWTGSAWAVLGTASGNVLAKRTFNFSTFVTNSIRVNVTAADCGYSNIAEIEAWGYASSAGTAANVALASAGAVASASSQYSNAFPASAAINNERAGANWGNGSGWNDGTFAAYPDSLQVAFAGMQSIDRVVVYTLQDNATNPSEPTDAMTFTSYGIVDFSVDGWNGSAWVALATVTANNRVKRSLTFTPFVTDRIRVNVTRAMGGYSHITEVEAWGVPAGSSSATNVALASVGAVASASSSYGPGFPASAVNNGERAGMGWGNGSGWNDGTVNAYPDWVQVDLNGTKSIDRVVVYTLQDNVMNPGEPTDTLTFTSYGIVDFEVQGWNGSAWVALGTVTGNNLVKRTVAFTPFTTNRVRVLVTRALGGYSHITEVETWGF
jgi:glucose/arabinose dehydrogenase